MHPVIHPTTAPQILTSLTHSTDPMIPLKFAQLDIVGLGSNTTT